MKFPRLILNFENNHFFLSEGSNLINIGNCCESIHIEKNGSHHAEISMKMVGSPQITGYLVSKEETAPTICECGEVLGYGLRGCIVRCNFCGKESEI